MRLWNWEPEGNGREERGIELQLRIHIYIYMRIRVEWKHILDLIFLRLWAALTSRRKSQSGFSCCCQEQSTIYPRSLPVRFRFLQGLRSKGFKSSSGVARFVGRLNSRPIVCGQIKILSVCCFPHSREKLGQVGEYCLFRIVQRPTTDFCSIFPRRFL